MSNIDKHAQGEKKREAFERWAEQSGALPWGTLKKHRNQDGTYPGPHYTYMWHAWNACHEALLDELEAKDNRINRLEAIVAVAEQRNALMREWKRALKVPCDLVDDQVPVVIHGMVIRLARLKETEDKLTAAEKRIAELERKEQHSERQSVIDALAGSGETWSDIEEYMQKWDAARAAMLQGAENAESLHAVKVEPLLNSSAKGIELQHADFQAKADGNSPVIPDWQTKAEKMSEIHGTSFVVFKNGESPQCADPSKVIISFTDEGLGYGSAAPQQEA